MKTNSYSLLCALVIFQATSAFAQTNNVCGGTAPTLVSGTAANGYTDNDYINRVYLRGENNSNQDYLYIDNNLNSHGPGGPGSFSVHPPDYEQFPLAPFKTAILIPGANYAAPSLVSGNPVGAGLALQCGAKNVNNYLAAWIDFNIDGDFLDPGEQICQSSGKNAFGWIFSTVHVPSAIGSSTANAGTAAASAGVVYGNTVLRVREVRAEPAIQPCQSGYTYGETEDYFITILPPCNTGFKQWLGYTDDWNTPSNWCSATIPELSDVVIINRALSGTGNYHTPVIHENTSAMARSVMISDQDTLIADAAAGSSLQVIDTLSIAYNNPAGSATGLFKINTFQTDTAQLSNGNLSFQITPFQATRKEMRMQLVYTKAELLQKNLVSGSVIDEMIFHIWKKGNPTVSAYNSFTIKYATVDSTWGKWSTPPTSLAPATSAYTTIFGPVNLDLQSAVPDTQGTLTLAMIPNQFIWNGVSDIVVEFCYDNSLIPSSFANDLVTQTQTTGLNLTMWLNSSGAFPSGCVLNFPPAPPTVAVSTQFRPNITFKFRNTNNPFPVNITGNSANLPGNWINNGSFSAGNSVVTFSGSHNQTIGGASITTFGRITLDKSGGKVTMLQDVKVDSVLSLSGGKLELNKKLLTINKNSGTGISRTSGGILSETVNPPYGTIKWKINNTTSDHIFPFVTGSSDYIPFTYKVTSGNVGNISVSTYPSDGNRKPFPTGVTNINDSLGVNDKNYVVKRFWVIDKTGSGGVANLKFSYKNSEAPAPIIKSNLEANRYDYASDLWQRFTIPMTVVTGGSVSSVTINQVPTSGLASAVWALSDGSSPLRISDDIQMATAWPNPFTESFSVSWNNEETCKLTIFDLSGRKVYGQNINSGEMVFPGQNLQPGMYVIELKSSKFIRQFRMLKEL